MGRDVHVMDSQLAKQTDLVSYHHCQPLLPVLSASYSLRKISHLSSLTPTITISSLLHSDNDRPTGWWTWNVRERARTGMRSLATHSRTQAIAECVACDQVRTFLIECVCRKLYVPLWEGHLRRGIEIGTSKHQVNRLYSPEVGSGVVVE